MQHDDNLMSGTSSGDDVLVEILETEVGGALAFVTSFYSLRPHLVGVSDSDRCCPLKVIFGPTIKRRLENNSQANGHSYLCDLISVHDFDQYVFLIRVFIPPTQHLEFSVFCIYYKSTLQ